MAKKHTNAIIIGTIIGVLFLAFIGILLQNTLISEEIYDTDDYGIVTFRIYEQNFLQKLFGLSQETYFNKRTANIGDSITLTSTSLPPVIFQTGDVLEWEVYINGNEEFTLSKGVPNALTTSTKITVSFTANKAGEYTAKVYKLRIGTGRNYIDGAFLPLTVTTAPPSSCSKQPKWTSWNVVESFDWGTREKRTWQIVDGSCNYVDSTQSERKTDCANGYDIVGSSTATEMSGYQICELTQTTPDCTPVTTTCSDGSSITLESCVNGELVSTGNTCQEITYITVWRFDNNECYMLEILESDKTTNDYLTPLECSNLIETEDGGDDTVPVTVYRYANNKCTQLTIDESLRTTNDYDTILLCSANIEDSVTIYQSIGGACVETALSRVNLKDTDFSTKALCLASLSSGGFSLDDIVGGEIPWLIIGGGALAGVAIVLFLRRK